jgi:hypothetical protein
MSNTATEEAPPHPQVDWQASHADALIYLAYLREQLAWRDERCRAIEDLPGLLASEKRNLIVGYMNSADKVNDKVAEIRKVWDIE